VSKKQSSTIHSATRWNKNLTNTQQGRWWCISTCWSSGGRFSLDQKSRCADSFECQGRMMALIPLLQCPGLEIRGPFLFDRVVLMEHSRDCDINVSHNGSCSLRKRWTGIHSCTLILHADWNHDMKLKSSCLQFKLYSAIAGIDNHGAGSSLGAHISLRP
jgi:hypothetical protein